MELFKLFGTIAVDSSKAEKSIKQTTDQASKMGESISNNGKKVKKSLSEIAAESGKSVNEIRSEVSKIAAEYRKQGMDASAAMKQAYADIGYSANDTHKKIDDKLDTTAEKAQKVFKEISSKIKEVGDKISDVGKKLSPLSVAVGGVLTASVKGANDFQNGMAKMSTLFDTTQTSVNGLSEEFLQLSNETGLAATELSEAGYQALSAGRDVSEVGKFVETAGNLAKAGFTSTSTAVDILTTAMNAYGDNAGTADEISNKLVRTQNLGKTTVDELASSMGKIIPTASSMGVNIDNLTSGYVMLTKQGIATAEATTYMNSMMNELGDSGTTLGGVIKEKTGKSFQECMDSGMSLADVLQITKQYADDNGIAYNELWSSAEAGKAGLAILNGGVDEFNDTVSTMASKTDDVGEALEKLNTPTVKVKNAMNKMKNAGIELGTSFMTALSPTIEIVCDKVGQLVTWFDGLPEPMKTTIATIMAIIAVASPLLLIGGKVVSFIGTMVSGVSGFIGVLAGINPAVWAVIAVIGLLVTTGVLLYKNWDTVKAKAGELKEAISEKWNSIKEKTSEAWSNVKQTMSDKISSAKDYVSGKLDAIKQKYQEHGGGIEGIAAATMEGMKQYYSVGYDAINTLTGGKLDQLVGKFRSKMDSAKDAVKSGIDRIKSFFNFSWSLPKLKLPHFSVSGSFSLNPPQVPHFGISWYKKAMNDPMLLTEPTAFGLSQSGKLRVGGEAGDEIVGGKNAIRNMISEAVADQNRNVEYYLQKLIELLAKYFPEILDGLDKDIVLDDGVIAGRLAPRIDSNLGRILERKGRGI